MKKTKTVVTRSGLRIGHDQPCFLVAELGNNHQGEFSLAKEMVHAAAEIGAGGVKFQKRHTPSLLTEEGMAAPYTGPNSFGPTYGEHRDALELSIEQMAELKILCESLGLVFFASAWDMISLNQLAAMGMELVKICSADLVNTPMLRRAAAMNVPVIMSTGMSAYSDIDTAVAAIREFHDSIVLLHCNSSYPCHDQEIALPVMNALRERYGLSVGYSGHERGIGPSVASVALGACVVERHFTMDKTMRGTDHKASLTPDEFRLMASMIREVESAIQYKEKTVFPGEKSVAQKLRKSIVAARNLPAGHLLTDADLTCKSPGTGISPTHWDRCVGSILTQDMAKDEMLTFDMIEDVPEPLSQTAS